MRPCWPKIGYALTVLSDSHHVKMVVCFLLDQTYRDLSTTLILSGSELEMLNLKLSSTKDLPVGYALIAQQFFYKPLSQ